MSFLSSTNYGAFLEKRIQSLDDPRAQTHARKVFERWRQQYCANRLVERATELLASETARPTMLYLRCQADLEILHLLRQRHSFDARLFRGFLVADELWNRLQPESLSSFPVRRARDWRDEEGTVVVTLSEDRPFRTDTGDRGNDYLEQFIDLSRFQCVQQALSSFHGKTTVLYPLYREIHTVALMARCVRQKDERLRSISLSPAPLLNADFDRALVEPFLYLWPLLFEIVSPHLVHLNVGWGIQALALSPFIPDPRRTVVDFYEVLSFLPDAYFEKTHSTAEQVRFGEEHFFRNYDHIIHLCSDEISDRLTEKYDHHGSIVSVTEYLEEPVYCRPPRNDGEIRLVYGGCMLATTNPDDLYYRAFMNVVPHYSRGNLRLYVYNSPYVHGIAENDGLKEVIRTQGLTNVRACASLKLDDFVREISEYDFGVTLLRPKDMNAVEYNYFMATKVLTYLRAGLPVVIDADNHFLAGLIERYNIGVVLQDADLERLPDILNGVDLPALKRNVVKFRQEFSIEKGGEKVLKMYHEILRNREEQPRREAREVTVAPAATRIPGRTDFEAMIDVMARRENRLYYRDQSARTMASLADLAQQFDPSVIIELGTLGGLSLRTWVASTRQTRIYAVDLSFQTLRETLEFLPADLSRVTLLEQDILQTEFPRLWTSQDKVIFFVDAHDLPNVPIMTHVLTRALPSLPEGSVIVIDDLWFSAERLTSANARKFLEGRVLNEIDELQCFHGHFAPYHEGGSFLGFAEVIPLLRFVNEHGIPLVHDRGGKHAFFVWRKAYLEQGPTVAEGLDDSDDVYGSVQYNPLESVPVCDPHRETMRRIAALYLQRNIREAAERLSTALSQDPHDEGLSYGLAVCLARGGMPSQAKDVLARNLNVSSHPRYRRLFDDLARRAGMPEPHPTGAPQRPPETCGVTLFAMPKAFTGHTGTIQKNAIRSWARLEPSPEIILFGDEPGIREMADEIGAKHVPEIGRNEFGTPLVDKLFEAAQDHASHRVLAYVNADMILLQDFLKGVEAVQSRLAEFLLIGQRWDLCVLDEIDFSGSSWREALVREVQEHAMLHAECGLDYFVFRKGLWPQIPSFAIGRTAWDNWLVMDPRRRGVPVVDGTECITAVHQEHDYGHVAGGRNEAWNGEEARRNLSLAGVLDDSSYTSGAAWILDKEGRLVKAQARQSEFSTPTHRCRRVVWLARQAEELTALGKMEIAACKWEEAVTILDKLLTAIERQSGPVTFSHDNPMAKSYTLACTSLARCYVELGCPDRAVACYTRLLETACIEIPQGQRDDIARERSRLLEHQAKDHTQAGLSSAGADDLHVAGEAGHPATPRAVGPHPTPEGLPVTERCSITLFAMPKAFTGHTGTIQKNAIRSWARLEPSPEIILFGDEPGIREMADEIGAKHIGEISRNEFGTPLVDKLFEAAQDHASNPVLAYVNADMILMQDFMKGVEAVQSRLVEFLLIGQRWDLCVLDEMDFSGSSWREALVREVREHAMLHAECGLDYFVFRKGLWAQIPPFAIGRTAWDNWLVMDPRRRGVPVVDGTECITAVHQEHDYGHVTGGRQEVWNGPEAQRNRALAGKTNHAGLTSGAAWLLRKDGELVETGQRQPRYVMAAYREQRSEWLLGEAKRLSGIGARELAASKCEETTEWLDTWLQLRQMGSALSEPEHPVDIAGYYIAACTLLAQCCMQMGFYERVVAAYTRLLEHPLMQMPAAQKNRIVQVRDLLSRRLAAGKQPGDAPAGEVCGDAGPRMDPPRSSETPVLRPPSISAGGGAAADRRPKVTVITPCHNSERYLDDCVESVLGQTMTEWELFLIDDGSTDDTRRMIEEYARRDARIRPFHFPDNRGPYVRRNFAICRAASDFIVIQDADDIMAPTKLERLYGEIRRDDDLAMVGSFIRTFLEEFRGLEHTGRNEPSLDSDAILASCAAWQAAISHGAAIIRKALFDKIGLYDENPFAADSFWSAKLALYAETGAVVKMANVPEHLTLIRIHRESQTHTLPVFDPRNRRVRYRRYCECSLQRIREKWRRQPQLDVAAELRRCDCSDFLTRFKAQILQWESEVLPIHFLNDLLKGAAVAFQSQSYVTCVAILNGLEAMRWDMAQRVAGFNLFRAMALHASGLPDRGRTYAQWEIENHDSSVARRFLQDSREQGASMVVPRWYAEHASHLKLKLEDGDPVRIGMTTA